MGKVRRPRDERLMTAIAPSVIVGEREFNRTTRIELETQPGASRSVTLAITRSRKIWVNSPPVNGDDRVAGDKAGLFSGTGRPDVAHDETIGETRRT